MYYLIVEQAKSHIGRVIHCLWIMFGMKEINSNTISSAAKCIFLMPYVPLSANSFDLDNQNTDHLALAGDKGKRIWCIKGF